MTIRSAILLGCLALTLVTAALGLFSRRTEQELGLLAERIYDRAFMSMSYLRSAQNGFARAAGECRLHGAAGCRALADKVPDILDDLAVAQERALSERGRRAVAALADGLRGLQGSADAALDALDARFDEAVEMFAGDGYVDRRMVRDTVARADRSTWAALGASVVLACAITALLTAWIVPPLRRAASIAQAIAAGRLDPPRTRTGRSEPARLMRALAQLCVDLKRLQALEAASRRAERDAVAAEAAAELRITLTRQYEATVGTAAAGVIRTAGEQARIMAVIAGQAEQGAQGWSAIAGAVRATARESQSVTLAAEELSSTVSEISRQVFCGADMARGAAVVVQSMTTTVEVLVGTVDRISSIVRLIGGIAHRTKLLALNAAIEATHAGPAGRGFTVVATEVRELATQAARATTEITGQIVDVHGATRDAVQAIRHVEAAINQLTGMSMEIAGAVSKQDQATREIVASMARVATEAERVKGELRTLETGHEELSATLTTLGNVADEANAQGRIIQRESRSFLDQLRSA